MKFLTRNEILTVSDLVIEAVLIPEWGEDCGVNVRGLTGTERDRFEGSILQTKGNDRVINMANVRAKLVSLATCDESGKHLFSEADVKALGAKNAAALDRIFSVAQRLSGIGAADLKELTEETAKDQLKEGLETDPFEDSPSG